MQHASRSAFSFPAANRRWGVLAPLCLFLALEGCRKGGQESNGSTEPGRPGAASSGARPGGGNGPGGQEGPPAPIPAVEALPARFGSLPLEDRVSGIVRARNQVAIRPEISGPIVEVLVRNGDRVVKGQPLVRLQPTPVRHQLAEASAAVSLAQAAASASRARLKELEAQVSRTRELATKGDQSYVSELEVETQEAQLLAAQAAVKQAEARVAESQAAVGQRRSVVGQTTVRSPVSGHVGQRSAEVGMLVGPDHVLFLVGDLDDLVVDVPITESMLARVREGQTVRLFGRAFADEPMTATLSRISPFLSAGSFSTTAEIDVTDSSGRLRPGMFVAADILYGESEEATLVPTSALWEDPQTGKLSVYVVDMDKDAEVPETEMGELGALPRNFSERPIEVLAHGRAMVGIKGVKTGEWVVTIGQHLLATRSAKTARVRPTSWDRVLKLQSLQEEDLLAGFLEKQQRIAKTLGSRPPTSDSFVNTGASDPENARKLGP